MNVVCCAGAVPEGRCFSKDLINNGLVIGLDGNDCDVAVGFFGKEVGTGKGVG